MDARDYNYLAQCSPYKPAEAKRQCKQPCNNMHQHHFHRMENRPDHKQTKAKRSKHRYKRRDNQIQRIDYMVMKPLFNLGTKKSYNKRREHEL